MFSKVALYGRMRAHGGGGLGDDVLVFSKSYSCSPIAPRSRPLPRHARAKFCLWSGTVRKAREPFIAPYPASPSARCRCNCEHLLETGLVETRAEGRSRLYRARAAELGIFAQMLERMWDDKLWSPKLAAELEESRRGRRAGSQKKTS